VVELAGPLSELNERLVSPHLTPRQRWDIDRRWHETLVGKNPNRALAELLERTKRRVRHYDGAWDRGMADLEGSRDEHAAIASLLGEGKGDEAAEAVLKHWVRGIRTVSAWLARQPG
jgi:DNA-binding GntR family transcriptional regulator